MVSQLGKLRPERSDLPKVMRTITELKLEPQFWGHFITRMHFLTSLSVSVYTCKMDDNNTCLFVSGFSIKDKESSFSCFHQRNCPKQQHGKQKQKLSFDETGSQLNPKAQNRWLDGQSSGKGTGCMQEERTDALATDFWEYQQRTLLAAEGKP